MNIPTWVWYVAGALLFVGIYLYLRSSSTATTNPIGQTITVPSTGDLANYQGSADILTQLLQQQQTELQQLGQHPPSTSTSNK